MISTLAHVERLRAWLPPFEDVTQVTATPAASA
jgi:hypothetical protein